MTNHGCHDHCTSFIWCVCVLSFLVYACTHPHICPLTQTQHPCTIHEHTHTHTHTHLSQPGFSEPLQGYLSLQMVVTSLVLKWIPNALLQDPTSDAKRCLSVCLCTVQLCHVPCYGWGSHYHMLCFPVNKIDDLYYPSLPPPPCPVLTSSLLWDSVLSVDIVKEVAHIHCHRTPGEI